MKTNKQTVKKIVKRHCSRSKFVGILGEIYTKANWNVPVYATKIHGNEVVFNTKDLSYWQEVLNELPKTDTYNY